MFVTSSTFVTAGAWSCESFYIAAMMEASLLKLQCGSCKCFQADCALSTMALLLQYRFLQSGSISRWEPWCTTRDPLFDQVVSNGIWWRDPELVFGFVHVA